MKNPTFFDNPYPSTVATNFNNTSEQNLQSENTQNNQLVQKLLPLILSKKDLSEILPTLFSNNPLFSAIMSNMKTAKVQATSTKIQSDKIDTSGLQKIT